MRWQAALLAFAFPGAGIVSLEPELRLFCFNRGCPNGKRGRMSDRRGGGKAWLYIVH